jgi:hypothetical protein
MKKITESKPSFLPIAGFGPMPHPPSVRTPATQREEKLRETGRERDHKGNVSDRGRGNYRAVQKSFVLYLLIILFQLSIAKTGRQGVTEQTLHH